MKLHWFYIMGLVALISCKSEYLQEEELKKYILDPDNGLTLIHEVGDYEIALSYRPNDLIIAQETNGSIRVEADELARLNKKYEDYYYFILSMSRNQKEAEYQSADFGQFSELVQTLSFRMDQYVSMTTSATDTIPVGDFIYPRTFGMSSASTLMFVFHKQKAVGQDWVQFNMKEFGLGVGRQSFRFRVEDLENAPKIRFEPV